jgi:hypothetical protein
MSFSSEELRTISSESSLFEIAQRVPNPNTISNHSTLPTRSVGGELAES